MAEIKESSLRLGMDYNISYDVSRFLDASIQSVLKTLLSLSILVFIVVYIFLQDFRSTLNRLSPYQFHWSVHSFCGNAGLLHKYVDFIRLLCARNRYCSR